ncbi:hypothetical protein NBO_1098g0001 [Nosema bombycis CQ1]|uniref:Uncharacterized protein n=1 Tax=Nosema bombycis (strain CQ1 / CVCC 102059) TaxID=578461 RepID=R0KN14_NOSB1|nr:hypothetical protein NBO_1098g0001 [Nosema bombycis CQ1]|eukprot:EOB11532.1 hypothetical protein NBO_1098g0001 [Nosema bombycis CQ1]
MYKTKCEIYKNKCEELEGHSIKLSKFENQQIVINTMVQIPNEIVNILYELNHNLNDIVNNMIMVCDQYENIGSDYKNFIFLIKNDLQEKDSIIKSLIENNLNSNNIDSLIKHENNMLKNEIILLKSKLDNFQSEEYTDVIEKLDQIRTENENIREYVTNLNSEILKKDHSIRNLEDNLHEITQKSRETNEILETKEILIV